jgi:acyl-CoA thioesterase I
MRFLWVAGLIMAAALAQAGENAIRYVAIGDSYSIGEGASPEGSWPALLARNLSESGVPLKLVANPSRTGWTTQQAIDRELPVLIKARPDFATLQIGVNDWVQGVPEKTFRERFIFLIDRMLELLPGKDRLLIVTIPDFGVTPTGAGYAGGRNISAGISAFNHIIAEEAGRRALRVVDVFELSRKMKGDPSLVAADGLHPSAKEYAEWEKLIEPEARALLAR